MLASWVPIPWAGYKRGLRRKLVSRGCYHHHYMSQSRTFAMESSSHPPGGFSSCQLAHPLSSREHQENRRLEGPVEELGVTVLEEVVQSLAQGGVCGQPLRKMPPSTYI